MLVKEYLVEGAFGSNKTRPGFFLGEYAFVKTSLPPPSYPYTMLDGSYLVALPALNIRKVKFIKFISITSSATNSFIMKAKFIIIGERLAPTTINQPIAAKFGLPEAVSIEDNAGVKHTNQPPYADPVWMAIITKNNPTVGGIIDKTQQAAHDWAVSEIPSTYAAIVARTLGQEEAIKEFFATLEPIVLVKAAAGDPVALQTVSDTLGETLTVAHFQDTTEIAAAVKEVLSEAVGKETLPVNQEEPVIEETPATETAVTAEPAPATEAAPETAPEVTEKAAPETELAPAAAPAELAPVSPTDAVLVAFTGLANTLTDVAKTNESIAKTNAQTAEINAGILDKLVAMGASVAAPAKVEIVDAEQLS